MPAQPGEPTSVPSGERGKGLALGIGLSVLLHLSLAFVLPRFTGSNRNSNVPQAVEVSLLPPVPVRATPPQVPRRTVRRPSGGHYSRTARGQSGGQPRSRSVSPRHASSAPQRGKSPGSPPLRLATRTALPVAPTPAFASPEPESRHSLAFTPDEERPSVAPPEFRPEAAPNASAVGSGAKPTDNGNGSGVASGAGGTGQPGAGNGSGVGNGAGEGSGEGGRGQGGDGSDGRGAGGREPVQPRRPPVEPRGPEPRPAVPTLREPEAPAPVRPEPPARSAEPPTSVEPPPLIQPRYRRNPPPAYPRDARRDHKEGTVRLAVRVDIHGDVEQVEIVESSGTAALDAAAREAVLHWKFEPGRRGETPVACRVTVPIHFRLD